MTGSCLILLCLLTVDRPTTAPPAVQISTVEGATLDVQIIAIQSDVLHYRASGRDAQIPIADLERITLTAAPSAPTLPKNETICTFYFADGGLLEGQILPAKDDSEKGIRVNAGLAQPLTLRLEALAAIRFGRAGHAASEAEFDTRLAHRVAGRDLLIVPQGAKAVVLPGALERLGPQQWAFRFGDKLQTASLDKAYGVVLGGVSPLDAERAALLQLAGRNRIAGRLRSADAASLQVDAGSLGELTLAWQAISTISLRSRRVVYLSDLEPMTTTQRSLFDVAWPPRRDTNVTGGPIVVNNRGYPKGLGVHTYTAVTYKLDGGFERFIATIGIDDSAAEGGSAVFRVRGDDRTLYESAVITPRESKAVTLDVHGVRQLTLECDGGADLDLADHGDWADARLISAPTNETR